MRAENFFASLVNFFTGLVALILGLRIVFRLFNANPDASFVDWIYRMSEPLMAPFRGIFPSVPIDRGIVLDTTAIFALIIYLAIGALLLALVARYPAPTWRYSRADVDDRPARRRR